MSLLIFLDMYNTVTVIVLMSLSANSNTYVNSGSVSLHFPLHYFLLYKTGKFFHWMLDIVNIGC